MESMSEFTPLEEMQFGYNDIEEKMHRYLRSKGWTYTSSTPDSCWMYQKELPDGRTILVSFSKAVDYQISWDQLDQNEE